MQESLYMVPIKNVGYVKEQKAPTVSITTWKNKKIPAEKFTTGRYGIQTGYDGLEVLDIDNHFKNADEYFDFVCDNFDFRKHPIVKTQSGGYHIYYRCADVGGSTKLAFDVSDEYPKGSAFYETRGVGGYVLSPPTEGYTLIQGDLCDIPEISVEDHSNIFEICRSQNKYFKPEQIRGSFNASDSEKSGSMFNHDSRSLDECRLILESKGWTRVKSDGTMWRRPGKTKGVSATLGVKSFPSCGPVFHVFSDNGNISSGSYSLFGLFAEFEHAGNYADAARELGKRYNKFQKREIPQEKTIPTGDANDGLDGMRDLIRVGTKYFKKIDTGKGRINLKVWDRQTIIDDFGKDSHKAIPKYHDFCNIPSHTDYKQVHGHLYNLYSPVKIKPSPVSGAWPNIEKLIYHLFNEHYELALDWIQIAYLNPYQKLPVICLVSKLNGVGKGTFGKLLKFIFSDNYASITQEQYKSEFNSSYITKSIVNIEEGKMEPKQFERLKKDVTSSDGSLRKMHADGVPIDIFIKYVIESNDVTTFITAKKEDERFWVRDIKQKADFDPDFIDKLEAETPYFLHSLLYRKLHVPVQEYRLWFDPKRYRTEALANVVRSSRPQGITDMYQFILDDLTDKEKNSICINLRDLKDDYCRNDKTVSTSLIKHSITDEFGIEYLNGRYNKWDNNLFPGLAKEKKGSYFCITGEMLANALGEKFEYSDENTEDEMPF